MLNEFLLLKEGSKMPSKRTHKITLSANLYNLSSNFIQT